MREIKCHVDNKFRYSNRPEWQEIGRELRCTYCGSIAPETLKRMLLEGAKLESADWKYGWPHKFYLHPKNGGMYKWYNEHLLDLNDIEFTEFANLLETCSGIRFSRVSGKLLYKFPVKHEENATPSD